MKKQNNDDVIFLRGKRLYMRPPTKDDIPYFLRWLNDPEVRQYLGNFLPITELDEIEWLERLHKNKHEDSVFVIVDMKSGKPIGIMGIHRINWKDRTAITGAVIGEKKFWGKGYGTEAKMLLLDHAFNSLNLRKISSQVISYNKRSEAYSKKCGYRVEGIFKKQIFKKGRYWDLLNLAVHRKAWRRHWKKFRKANNIK